MALGWFKEENTEDKIKLSISRQTKSTKAIKENRNMLMNEGIKVLAKGQKLKNV